MKKLTVFTPTYNRCYSLNKSYNALCGQTSQDFVWLIVDDGSTDNTREQVRSWQNEGIIEIKYVYQENHGKQRAVNTGIAHCATPYFGFLDSDDYYLPGTVERFLEDFAVIEGDVSVAGVLARRGSDETTVLGSANLPKGRYVLNYDVLVVKYHFYGETCRAYKTDVLKQYLYPEIEDKFIPENVMLSAIDQDYDLLIANEIYSISRYLDDGYTKQGHALLHRNPKGYALSLAQTSLCRVGILKRAKRVVLFSVWCKLKTIPHPEAMLKKKALYYLVKPISFVAYLAKRPRWFFEEW